MKIRNRNAGATKIEVPMAPMIDVVFQLLIFFMLTLKIVAPEGDFSINMPLGVPSQSAVTDADLPPFRVRMEADPQTGELVQLLFNGNALGNDPRQAFPLLNREVMRAVEALKATGPGNLDKQEVEIDPDYGLKYEYIIAAISSCSGRMENGKVIPFISKIKFAPIRQEQ